MNAKILIVDDEITVRETLKELFSSRGYRVYLSSSDVEAINLMKGIKCESVIPDLVLLDVNLPGRKAVSCVQEIKNISEDTAVIVTTEYGSISQSVEAMKNGASDYISKPFNLDEVMLRVEKVLENRNLKDQVGYLSHKMYGDWKERCVVGSDIKMKKIYDNLGVIAKSNASTVFIAGETGTGKELIAHRIHALSNRSSGPFVEINVTALTAELLESELFGHEMGAFTGAVDSKKGLFEVANGGTLFLDEIGDMDLAMQAKILRALQERKIRRVGGTKHIEVDIRLITATNKNLEDAVRSGKFREDLYFRLNVVPIFLPPLRDRPDDMEALVNFFIESFNREFGRSVEGFNEAAIEYLKSYSWPGNIRELRNIIERTILLECDGPILRRRHIKLTNLDAEIYDHGEPDQKIGQDIPLALIEKEHIEGVLRSNRGNKNKTAQILGIDRTTLYNKIKKYEISL